jgi:ABC-type ATPase with predicted acetyltransferase domain
MELAKDVMRIKSDIKPMTMELKTTSSSLLDSLCQSKERELILDGMRFQAKTKTKKKPINCKNLESWIQQFIDKENITMSVKDLINSIKCSQTTGADSKDVLCITKL